VRVGRTTDDVLDELFADEQVLERRSYLEFHRRRYAVLLERVREVVEEVGNRGGPIRLLDVGPSFETVVFRELLDGVAVDTLGLEPSTSRPRPGETHLAFDLNRSDDQSAWPAVADAYDLVVMAEVLEHLYTAPDVVLAFVRSLVRDAGMLVLQTPNAVSLHHRVKMLAGRNPFEMIRRSCGNPGHFREYTISELDGVLRTAGFRLDRHMISNYFGDPSSRRSRFYNAVCGVLPPALRDGITLVATAN
jgi:hypothetical protein